MANQAVPTKEEVATEVEKLRELKGKVIRRSVFGDSHPDAIQAQIDCLTNAWWDEDEIYDRFSEEDETYLRNSALAALAWRDEGILEDADEGDTLSTGWEGLVDA